ncbi:ribonuclease H-like domain-containing protein [Candidatus Pacearchaeota archaeon]|nr:ribonuclease H-like domain-containing protein [Candidatus Pacearchaeota archaeon]
METTIKFIPIDYDYFDFNQKNYAKITGRDEKNRKVTIIDTCDIYFWAILHKKIKEKDIQKIRKKIEDIRVEKENRKSRVIKTELHNKKYLGQDVKAIKIFITNLKDAHAIADQINFKEIDKRREYDLPFITKYIMEKKLKPLSCYEIKGEILNNSQEFGGIDLILNTDLCLKVEKISEIEPFSFKPKILAYDIESEEFEIGKGEILMISLVGENFKKVLTWKIKNSKHPYVESYKDEASMLEAFIKYIKSYNPDILTGYFSDEFDLPYLRARAEKNNLRLSIGIDNSQPQFSRGRNLVGKIKGIVHIDMLKFIKTNYSQYLQSETLSLNDVSQELLGENKKEWEFKHSSKINNEEWETFIEYNLYDSILTYKLCEKSWPDMQEFARIIQEPLFDISRDGMSAHVENYITHNLERFNEIIEKRPLNNEIGERIEREKYEGAFVFQPKPGLYENICFFDFTSYWPSIIVTFNLSKSTFLGEKTKEKNILEVNVSGKKLYFSKKPGFFSEILKEIIEKRKQYKQEYAKNPNPFTKARSNAFKLLANASYGYQGFFGARYYCPEASAAATAISREFTKKTIETINKKAYEVIYGDTDSIALKLNKHSKKETLQLLKEINSKLPGIMELDLEDFYKRGIWVTKRTGEFGAKKKYALINEQDKIKIRGFETVRRDWCTLARETQNKVLNHILKEGNEKKALEYAKEIIKKLKERKIELKELMIRTQLKKPIEEYKSESPHVTIAKKMKELGIPVDIGMLIQYYISEPEANQKTKTGKTKGLIRERAKLPDEKGEYDLGYYLNNQILPAIENIFEVFNINTKEMLDGKKQMKLLDF